MARNYACARCSSPCYSKGLRNCPPYGYICKDCRVRLGLEEYEKWTPPSWMVDRKI